MSFKKTIQYGKEKREPYRGSKRWAASCRNHGSCDYCRSNRTHFDKKARMRVEGQEDEWFGYWGMPDPSDVDAYVYEETCERFGVDPWDLDISGLA